MDLTSKVNRLLAEFAGRIGLPSLSLDEEGMASLLFDEQVGVTLLLLAEREASVAGGRCGGHRCAGRGDLSPARQLQPPLAPFRSAFRLRRADRQGQLYAQILAAQLTLECFEATLANLLDHAEFWQRLLPCDSDREAVAAVGMRV